MFGLTINPRCLLSVSIEHRWLLFYCFKETHTEKKHNNDSNKRECFSAFNHQMRGESLKDITLKGIQINVWEACWIIETWCLCYHKSIQMRAIKINRW